MAIGIDNRQVVDSMDFARSYDWDIWIQNLGNTKPHVSNLAGTDFSAWFPATVHTKTDFDVELQTFNVFIDTFSIPKSRGERTLDLTFLDNAVGTARKFFDDWVNKDIFNDGQGVSLLEDCPKEIVLVRYGPRGVGQDNAFGVRDALKSISNVFENPPSILGSIGRALSGPDLERPVVPSCVY